MIMIVLSMLGISFFNTLLYIAVHTTTAINGALIQTAMPAVIILISLLLYKETVSKIQVAGIVLCIFGASLVVLRGDITAILRLSLVEGDIFMSIAVVLYALYCVFLKKRPLIHPLSFLFYTFAIGAIGLFPAYVWEWSRGAQSVFNASAIFSILYVAIFPSIIAYFCWNRGVEMIGANRSGLFINLIPLFASIMAIFWLNESLELFHIVGIVLILSGMILFNR